jgi:hypothetical protein
MTLTVFTRLKRRIFESKAGAHPSGASYLGRNTIA